MHFKPVFVGTWYKMVALRRTLVKVRFCGLFMAQHVLQGNGEQGWPHLL